MADRFRTVQDVRVPTFIYGTAWKEERTAELVSRALEAGFRGIDTANQRKHYREDAVGRAVERALAWNTVRRDDLFLQTKFTHPAGQDHRMPYDPEAAVADQVQQSFESSLEHLGVERIDSYVLHGPSQRRGLGEADRAAWRAMETLHEGGRARMLGVSNVAPDQVAELWELARVKPAFVQNRCFARLRWDAPARRVCERLGVAYQAFSLLTANGRALASPAVRQIAERHRRTVPQVIFRFSLELGMFPLTGTTDPEHMRQDLAVYDLELSDEELRAIEEVVA